MSASRNGARDAEQRGYPARRRGVDAASGTASACVAGDGHRTGAPEGLDFASVLAISIHDMKNSVAAIIGGLNACLGITGDEGAREMLSAEGQRQRAMLLQEAYRLNAGLVELLTLYRAQQGLERLRPTAFDVLEWLEDRVAALLPAAEFAGIVFELEAEPGRSSKREEGRRAPSAYSPRGGVEDAAQDLWRVCWDARLLGVVVDNVLTNTLRYARRRIRVRVARVGPGGDAAADRRAERPASTAGGASCASGACAPATPWLRVTVEDDGDGYPVERLGRLPVAPRPSDRDAADRTGLGLYFAARIVDLHRDADRRPGWIEIDNGTTRADTADADALGGGRFTMWLPAWACPPTH